MVSISVINRPRIFFGSQRHLMLWVRSITPDIEQACLCFSETANLNSGLKALYQVLDLAFAMVFLEIKDGSLTLIAGPKNTYPLFFSVTGDGISISDTLAHSHCGSVLDNLDQEGLADYIAKIIVTGPYELSSNMETFDKRWQAVPAGKQVIFSKERKIIKVGSVDPVFEDLLEQLPSQQEAVEELRFSIDQHLIRLSQFGKVASELSGGIDSSVVRARCFAAIAPLYVGGVTCKFPYAEFAREISMQEAVLQQMPGEIATISHRDFLPFSLIPDIPLHTEPSLASTAWGAFGSAVAAAKSLGAGILLTGHGGDTLFRWQPNQPLTYQPPTDLTEWLPKGLRENVMDRAAAITTDLNRFSANGFGGLWHAGMFDPYSSQKMVQSKQIQVDYVSGLVCRNTLRSAAKLWLTNPKLEANIQKQFAYLVFGPDLPDVLWKRPGKVDHLGIVYRGAIAAREQILQVVDRSAFVIDELGASGTTLKKFARRATQGDDSANPMFSVMLSVVLWADQFRQEIKSDNSLSHYVYDGTRLGFNIKKEVA